MTNTAARIKQVDLRRAIKVALSFPDAGLRVRIAPDNSIIIERGNNNDMPEVALASSAEIRL